MDIFELFAMVNHDYEHIEKWGTDTFWNEIVGEIEPEDLANKIHFGSYNPFHDYVGFDGYGNIDSMDSGDYEEELLGYAGEFIEQAYSAGYIDEEQARELAEAFEVEI